LDVSHNQLTELTPFICKVKSLKELDIRNNQIQTLPVLLWDLPNLEKVFMDCSLFPYIPSEIRSDDTFVESIKYFIISGKNGIPISDTKIKEVFSTCCCINLIKNTVSLIYKKK